MLNNGVTDPTKVAKAVKIYNNYKKGIDANGKQLSAADRRMYQNNPYAALERAVSLAKWNRDAGKGIYEVNSRAKQAFMEQTVVQVRQSNPGMSDADATKKVQQILDEMEYFET